MNDEQKAILNPDLEKLVEKLKEIKSKGFEKTHRFHDNGVGKTLEDLLGIEENNFCLPDFGTIEIKAKRIDSNSRLTLATKSPKPRGVNKILFNLYKYLKEGVYKLHSVIYGSRKNKQSFQIVFEDDKLVLKNDRGIDAWWPISIFDDVLKAKADSILLVFTKTRGDKKSPNEEFHYADKAYLLSGLNVDKFKSAIENDKLIIEMRIGVVGSGKKIGAYHDHGTAFRIHIRDIAHLFDVYVQLL